MSEHLTQLQIEHYCQRRLSPSALLALDDHLAGCAFCRRRLREIKPMEETIGALRTNLEAVQLTASDHLTQGELSGYADNRLDEIERELVESHLEICEQCSAQVSSPSAPARRGNGNGDGEIREANGRNNNPVSPARAPWRGWVLPQAGWTAFSSRLRITTAILVITLLSLSGILLLQTVRNDSAQKSAASSTQSPSTLYAPVTPPTSSPPPTKALLSLKDGAGQVKLFADGQISGIDGISDEHRRLVIEALKNSRIEIPSILSDLRGRSSRLMGGDNAERFYLVDPVGEVILNDRPTLRWQPLNGAESYTVTIVDSRDNSADPVKSPPSDQTTWQVDRALRRGRIYTWQVAATKNGEEIIAPTPEAPPAKFKVLEQNKADEITQARKTHANRHLLLGLLYARAGLLEEATKELSALTATNPQSDEMKKLVDQLSSERRGAELNTR